MADMKPRSTSVYGHILISPRLTPLGAALLALAVALPAGGVLAVIDWLWL
ncbi:MAG: hypothetical protein ACI86S_000946 [Paracoccaceae bacterium]|jgi:hypothetical protein